MPVHFTILGSGSGGNCAYLETDETRLLIDAGFSGRQIRERLATIGRAPENLSGILITHEHTDHIMGIAGLCAKLNIPIYCNRLTREAIEQQFENRFNCQIFTTGASFDIGDVVVDTFSVPHDASDPVGFLLKTIAGKIGFLTDLGHVTKMVLERMRTANVLVLEANHDLKLLQASGRPWSLKQRIAGRHGHLSNEEAADALAEIMTAEMRHVYLGHLSRECNLPELAHRVIYERMHQIGATHVQLEVTSQQHASHRLKLEMVSSVQQGCLL